MMLIQGIASEERPPPHFAIKLKGKTHKKIQKGYSKSTCLGIAYRKDYSDIYSTI
jgi:UDP-N-acetyl-D-mannosaminuronate dehydrogenase